MSIVKSLCSIHPKVKFLASHLLDFIEGHFLGPVVIDKARGPTQKYSEIAQKSNKAQSQYFSRSFRLPLRFCFIKKREIPSLTLSDSNFLNAILRSLDPCDSLRDYSGAVRRWGLLYSDRIKRFLTGRPDTLIIYNKSVNEMRENQFYANCRSQNGFSFLQLVASSLDLWCISIDAHL